MCGFVGEIALAPTVARTSLYRRANVLLHRGPDESGLWLSPDTRWGVGHRRLCVVDPQGGRQPMREPQRGLTLVFNGEIYDHDRLRQRLANTYDFKTTSDTEVLLALYATYGIKCLEYLRGEFAFALFDEPRGVAWLVRDRMGLKPLFYTVLPDCVLFASEIKALLCDTRVERRLNPTGLLGALTVADTPGDTVFAGINQVKHAHTLRLDLRTLERQETRYWDAFANRRQDIPLSFAEQVDLVRQTVDEAIALRLRADVPMGAYLSGGLDSSLVTAVMAQRVERLDAFALAFDDSPRHNEYAYAQQVAGLYPNVRLHRIGVTHADLIRRLPETVWHLERPFGNLHSVAKIMSAQFARAYVVGVLTGDGGDESFCGYSTFWLQDILQQANYQLPAIRVQLAAMRREAAGIGGNRYYLFGGLARRIGPEARFLAETLGFPPADLAIAADSERQLRRLLLPEFAARISQSPLVGTTRFLIPTMPAATRWPHALLLQYIHLNTIVPEYIATIADRAEFAGSVEARPPLFDHKVVELAMGLPLASKLAGHREKHILREAYAPLLPKGVIERRKQAFLAPPAPFAGAEGRALLDRYLSSRALKNAGIWNPHRIAVLKIARKLLPHNRLLNLVLTIVMTTQIVHELFIESRRSYH